MTRIRTSRLTPGSRELARGLFNLMAQVFAEGCDLIYDLAVRDDQQRKGIGRELVRALREAAAAAGIPLILVAADNDDGHALDFYRAVGGVPSPVTFFTFSGSEE